MFSIFILIKYSIFDMFPSSSVVNAPTTEQKAPGSNLSVGGNFFWNFILKKKGFKIDFNAIKRQ